MLFCRVFGVSRVRDSASFTKTRIEDFRTKPYCLMNYLCTPYFDKVRCGCPLAYLASREIRPRTMVGNGPNERTVASSETCFGEVTQVRKIVVRVYVVPFVAPQPGAPPLPAASQNSTWTVSRFFG